MILDALAVFSDAQASTVSVASTDYIDTLAAGDAYVGAWVVVRVDTAYTSNNSTVTNTFQLQTSNDPLFLDSTSLTLVQSSAIIQTNLTAGKYWVTRLPMGMKRYIRVYKNIGSNGAADYWTAGKFDAFIVLDVSVWQNKRFLLQ